MENQTMPPRIVFRRTSVNKKVGWDISSSSSKDKEELMEIVKMIKDVNTEMETKFLVKKQ